MEIKNRNELNEFKKDKLFNSKDKHRFLNISKTKKPILMHVTISQIKP